MKFKILFTALTLLSSCAFANEFEYSLESNARSYSSGLSVTPMVAYKFALWGEADSPLEGAIRPKLSTEISPATYNGKVELEFSPVTFVNLSVARKLSRTYSHFDDDACMNNKCVGSLNSTEASAKTLFKFGPIMGSLKYTKVFYDSRDDKSQNFVDPSSYTLISPTNEIGNQIEGIVGTPITETLFTGVLIQNIELEKHKGNQNGQYLMFLKKNGNANYIAGAGRFKSELKEAKPSLLLSFRYEWK